MTKLKAFAKDNKGLMTTEAAVLVPMMLVGLCIVLAFMFVFYKWGAGQLIFDHLELSKRLELEPVYRLNLIDDARTTSSHSQSEKNYLGELNYRTSEATINLTPPYLETTKTLYFSQSKLSISMQREIQLAHWLHEKIQ